MSTYIPKSTSFTPAGTDLAVKLLKEIGVELSTYHGGSLNGKDIKKVMNNACHIFDKFLTIFKGGKRPNCTLLDANIDALCLQFREVFVL